MKTAFYWFALIAVILSRVINADTPWPLVPGRYMPPFHRQIGVMSLGDSKFTKTLPTDYAKHVTNIVVPFEEAKALTPEPDSRIHYSIDLGKWDYSSRAKMQERVSSLAPIAGRFSAWILNGDVASMVTNLRELEAFRKTVLAIRPRSALYLACPYQMGTAFEQCLPKSLEPIFSGVIWDLRFTNDFDPNCLGNALTCREVSEKFFAGMIPRFPSPADRGAKILSWSLRVSLSSLAGRGDPLRLLKALHTFFVNDPRSTYFLLGIDEANSKQLIAGIKPYSGIYPLLATLTTQQLQRNADLASDIENPFANDSRQIAAVGTKAFDADGVELNYGRPFMANRFAINFAPKNRPKSLAIYVSDGEAEYLLRKWDLPALPASSKTVKLYTDSFFFPQTKRLTFIPFGGKLDTASANGWVMVYKK